MTLFAWNVLQDKPWVPSSIVPGARGGIEQCWVDFLEQVPTTGVQLYYMLSIGNALSSFTLLLFREHCRNFLEMAIHDFMTLSLLVISYEYGGFRVGTLVLVVHDVCDIFINLSRCLNAARLEKTTVLSFGLLLCSWIYFRLWVFPLQIIWSTLFQAYAVMIFQGYLFCNIMLCSLVVLHVFWLYMFVRMIQGYVRKGKYDDNVDAKKARETESNSEQPEIITNSSITTSSLIAASKLSCDSFVQNN